MEHFSCLIWKDFFFLLLVEENQEEFPAILLRSSHSDGISLAAIPESVGQITASLGLFININSPSIVQTLELSDLHGFYGVQYHRNFEEQPWIMCAKILLQEKRKKKNCLWIHSGRKVKSLVSSRIRLGSFLVHVSYHRGLLEVHSGLEKVLKCLFGTKLLHTTGINRSFSCLEKEQIYPSCTAVCLCGILQRKVKGLLETVDAAGQPRALRFCNEAAVQTVKALFSAASEGKARQLPGVVPLMCSPFEGLGGQTLDACAEDMVQTQHVICTIIRLWVAAEADVRDRMSHVRVVSRSETAEDLLRCM